MVKRVKVKLFGTHNRTITIDADATDGAIIGRNLFWSDGTLVSEDELRGIIDNNGGSGTGIDQNILNYILSLLKDLEEGGAEATDWPIHKNFIAVDESLTIPTSFQYLISESFDVFGNLDIEAGAELVILSDAVPDAIGPDFTYNVGGDLTQIDYDAGEQKIFTYNVGGDLERVDFIQDDVTLRKDFFYTGGGDLDYVDEYYV